MLIISEKRNIIVEIDFPWRFKPELMKLLVGNFNGICVQLFSTIKLIYNEPSPRKKSGYCTKIFQTQSISMRMKNILLFVFPNLAHVETVKEKN